MRIKTLLLGSAAAFAFAGGSAQAADPNLSVAEPVDYVRVCDAFGAGYWYIPGTDTCIRIGGEVEFRVFFDESDEFHDDANWRFRTQFDLNATTKSMTDWGPLTTFVNLTGDSANGKSDDATVYADEYYLSLGPVLLGRTGSSFDIVGGGYTKNYGSTSVPDLSDHKVDQVQLSWAINGFGLVLALEDPEARWGSSATSDFPDLVAAISASGTGWDAGVAFLYSSQNADAFWGVQGNLEIDIWGDQLQLGALFADDGSSNDSVSDLVTEDGWAVLVSYQHNWSSNLYSAVTFLYVQEDNTDLVNPDGWDAQFTTAFSPADGLWVGADAGYSDRFDNWVFTLFAEREFGG